MPVLFRDWINLCDKPDSEVMQISMDYEEPEQIPETPDWKRLTGIV